MLRPAYYSDATIQVTDEWVKMRDRAYPMSDIKSAQISKVTADSLLVLSRILLRSGFVVALMMGALYLALTMRGDEEISIVIVILGVLAVQNMVVGLLIKEFRKPDYVYVVKLHGTVGKQEAVTSKDPEYAQEVAMAINTAVRNNH